MEAATVLATKKRLYRNNTGGWLGVVILDHRGEEQGTNVEPYGTIWLSDAEAILTARAPRRPEDNPFEQQTFRMQDQNTGVIKDVAFAPLTLEVDDERFVPAHDRFVPGINDDAEGRVAADAAARSAGPISAAAALRARQIEESATPPARAPEPVTLPEATPPSTGSQTPGVPTPPATPVPSGPAPAPRTAPDPHPGLQGASAPVAEDVEQQSWLPDPEAPGEVLPGSLSGETAADAPPASDPIEELFERPQAAVQTPAAEEHAAKVDPAIGEETGQARPPVAPPPEGEYATQEEVGSPNAPTHARPKGRPRATTRPIDHGPTEVEGV